MEVHRSPWNCKGQFTCCTPNGHPKVSFDCTYACRSMLPRPNSDQDLCVHRKDFRPSSMQFSWPETPLGNGVEKLRYTDYYRYVFPARQTAAHISSQENSLGEKDEASSTCAEVPIQIEHAGSIYVIMGTLKFVNLTTKGRFTNDLSPWCKRSVIRIFHIFISEGWYIKHEPRWRKPAVTQTACPPSLFC